MSDEREYILGTDRAELERLEFQHQVWVEQLYALCTRAGLRAGQSVLDLGCGPGFTARELARIVGRFGRVIACDESARFLEFLRAQAERQGLPQIEVRLGRVEALELADGSLDAVYARWLFCWLPDPGATLARVARMLRPGGMLLVQDYLDWGAMKLLPRSPAFERGVQACLKSWRVGGSAIDVQEVLPVRTRASAPWARSNGAGSRSSSRPTCPSWSSADSCCRRNSRPGARTGASARRRTRAGVSRRRWPTSCCVETRPPAARPAPRPRAACRRSRSPCSRPGRATRSAGASWDRARAAARSPRRRAARA